MKERDVRHYLLENLKGFGGHFEPIENSAGVGYPDVNFFVYDLEGWIEIKFIREYPVRPNTPVVGKCLRPAQSIWFNKRLAAGSRSIWLFIRVGPDFYLISGDKHEELEWWTAADLIKNSRWSSSLRMKNWELFVAHISKQF